MVLHHPVAQCGDRPGRQHESRLRPKWWRERHEAKLAEMPAHGELIYSATRSEKRGIWTVRRSAPIRSGVATVFTARNAGHSWFQGGHDRQPFVGISNGECDGMAAKGAVIARGEHSWPELHWSATGHVLASTRLLAIEASPAVYEILLDGCPAIRNDRRGDEGRPDHQSCIGR